MATIRIAKHQGVLRSALFLMLCGISALTFAQPQMSLSTDQFTITGSGASAGFSQTGTITTTAGAISKISDVPTTSGVGIPSFSFTLALANAVANSTYAFKVAVVIEDKDTPNRRMEASIGTLNLKVAANGTTVTGDIPGSQALTVHGQDGGGNTRITVTNATNTAANGPITISGGSVSFNGANLITRIRNANTLFDTILLPEFDQVANYNYWVVVQQTAGTAVQFGKATGGFAEFTGQPATLTYMKILTPYTAGAFKPYSVNGEFNVKPFTSSSGGGGTSTPVVVTQQTTELSNQVSSLPTTGTLTTQDAEKFDAAAKKAIELFTSLATGFANGSVTTTNLASSATAFASFTNAFATGTKLPSSTPLDTQPFSEGITKFSEIVDAAKTKGDATPAQKESIITNGTAIVNNISDVISAANLSPEVKKTLAEAARKALSSLAGLNDNTIDEKIFKTGQTVGDTIVKTDPKLKEAFACTPTSTQGLKLYALTSANNDLQTAQSLTLSSITASNLTNTGYSILGQVLGAGVPFSNFGTDPAFSQISTTINSATTTTADVISGALGGSPGGTPLSAAELNAIANRASSNSLLLTLNSITPIFTDTQIPDQLAQVTTRLSEITKAITTPKLTSGIEAVFNNGAPCGTQSLLGLGLSQSVQGPDLSPAASNGMALNLNEIGFAVETTATGDILITSGDSKFITRYFDTIIMPSFFPNDFYPTPEGQILFVANGIGYKIAPTAFDSAGFGAAVSSAGYTAISRPDNSIAIDLGAGQHFAGAFAYDNVGTAASCGTTTLTAPTGAPASSGYVYTVNCSSGISQRIAPYPYHADFFTSLDNANIGYLMDRSLGVIAIDTVGLLKISFFVTPLSTEDTAYFNANKNTNGIAFRAKDANGDGKTDYEVISATGVQLMYGL